jgi:hypothetical protein
MENKIPSILTSLTNRLTEKHILRLGDILENTSIKDNLTVSFILEDLDEPVVITSDARTLLRDLSSHMLGLEVIKLSFTNKKIVVLERELVK